ncbi:HNH endonuclease family protein [Gordonia sp. CPCC 206044]|uniref:HNH endonuclease family protein n=1 Tax=Gordonia sp. CPCC 206044 TaxID=3140793 RepID=UPI003AF379C9
MIRRLATLLLGAVVILAVGVLGGFIHTDTVDVAKRSFDSLITAEQSAPPPATAAGSPDRAHGDIAALLQHVRVVDTVTEVDGYERSCRKNKACVFGKAWTDDSAAPLSHNGCDTRNDVLRQQLTQVITDPQSRGCKVLSGVLDPDPYTGEVIDFRKGSTSGDVEIDHVFPLEQSWHSGASVWPLAKRVQFANDPANLLAVDGGRNSAKGSKPISEWLPSNSAYVCSYIARYLEVAQAYELPITAADKATAEHTC